MKNFIFCIFLCTTSINLYPSQQESNTNVQDEDFALLQEAIDIVASMSDNIANLIIEYKLDTHKIEVTKQECISIVEKLKSLVLIILKKQKLKKVSRAIFICPTFDPEKRIEDLAEELLYKVNF